jgi:hypothetical protein
LGRGRTPANKEAIQQTGLNLGFFFFVILKANKLVKDRGESNRPLPFPQRHLNSGGVGYMSGSKDIGSERSRNVACRSRYISRRCPCLLDENNHSLA